MYQSEVKPATVLQLVNAPPVTTAMSPESSSSSSAAPAAYGTASATAASVSNLRFPSPSSSDHLQQIHSAPDPWLVPPHASQAIPLSQHQHRHHQSSWESHSTIAYFPQPRQSSPYPKPRRNQILPVGCKRGGSTAIAGSSGGKGFRGLREEGEESCRTTNGSGSPADSGGRTEVVNGTAAAASATKRCRVCGDRAVNHNFGQLTCESCKAFFRRNAHKALLSISVALQSSDNDETNTDVYFQALKQGLSDLTCTSKSGEHVVSPSTRRECPACRLKRCFLIGMRPDLIQVRKKDGTKPRWLDKYPAAAQVHEHHVSRSEVSKMLRLQQNSSPVDSSHRDLYGLAYPRYSDAPHQMGGSQLIKGSRAFETYPPDATYVVSQSVTASHPPPPTPASSQNSGALYEENGRGVSAALSGEVNTASGGFPIKTELSSPQYRTPGDCVVLTNPLADENARHKGSTWSHQVGDNFSLPISNSTWLQPHAAYQTTHLQSSDMLILDSFNSEHSLFPNSQAHERRDPASLDAYTGLPLAESHSGASSGSTTSPSVASSAPNFGSCCSDTTQGNFDSTVTKSGMSEWMPATEVEAGGMYLQNLSPLKNKMSDSAVSDLRQAFLPPAEGDRWFNRLTMAWRTAWRDGVFPNPSQVRFHLDLDPISADEETEDWRLTLANIWSDLLLRRVADFASSLFQPLGTESSNDLQNRLVNCVPIILACGLLQSPELNVTPSSPVPQSQNQRNGGVDDSGSSPRSPKDFEASSGGTSSASPRANGVLRAATPTLSVGFQVAPQHRVFISLSRLNAKLAENHATAAYPMLQYLDAYVCELKKFLTEQSLLLGAYMAVKLTEPPTPAELMQNLLTDVDMHQIHSLNVKFLHLFGMAADHVASLIVSGELRDSLHAQAKAMNDAICRRTKLPDFLSWGRQFDDNMKSLLYDIWNVSRHQPQAFISPGLAAFCGDSSQSSANLLHLLSAPTSDEVLHAV